MTDIILVSYIESFFDISCYRNFFFIKIHYNLKIIQDNHSSITYGPITCFLVHLNLLHNFIHHLKTQKMEYITKKIFYKYRTFDLQEPKQ